MFWKNLLTTSAKTAAAAVAGSLATSSGVNSDWYERLEKPDFQPPPATVTAAALTVSSADLARRAGRAGRGKTLALLPYVGWCTFATVLSGKIDVLNP